MPAGATAYCANFRNPSVVLMERSGCIPIFGHRLLPVALVAPQFILTSPYIPFLHGPLCEAVWSSRDAAGSFWIAYSQFAGS